MKTTRKDISPVKVELTVTLDATELATAEKVALAKLAQNVKVPGFRQGKVPLGVAAKHVNPTQLMEQTLDDAVSKAVATAFLEADIQALDRPQVDVKKFVPGQEVEFTAEVEIMPEVKLGHYKKLGVKRQDDKVKQTEVDEIIDRMRRGFAERKAVKREAKTGDEVLIDYEGVRDEKPFTGGTARDYTLELGTNTFIDGFEDAIIGHKAGDEFNVPLTFPKDYHAESLAGVPVLFKVKLKKVTELTLPAVDDEFAKKSGPFTTADELKADIKREISTRKAAANDEKFKEALVDKLVDGSTIPVPEVLRHEQLHRLQQEIRQNLAYRGATLDEYLNEKGLANEDEWHDSAELREQAERRLKGGLALAELSKLEKITATDAELDARHAQMLGQYSDAESRKQLSTPEARQEIANRLLTEKTVERLVELNTAK